MSLLMSVREHILTDAHIQALAALANQGQAVEPTRQALQAWMDYPVRFEDRERALLDVDHLLQLTAGAEARPSVAARVRPNLSETIVQVDNLFTTSLEDYRRRFIDANHLDEQARAQFQANFFDVLAGSIGREAASHARLALELVDSRPIKYPLAVILGAWGFWKGLLWNPSKRVTETIQREREGSHQRINWLRIVKYEEEKRVVASKQLIEARVQILLTTLQRSQELDRDLLNEMNELDRLYTHFSRDVTLRIGQVLIGDFIREKNALINSALHTVVEKPEGSS